MAKYYVSSGGFRRAISRPQARQAAQDAFLDDIVQGGQIDAYGDVTEVSETGFDFKPDHGLFFSTNGLLKEIGVL